VIVVDESPERAVHENNYHHCAQYWLEVRDAAALPLQRKPVCEFGDVRSALTLYEAFLRASSYKNIRMFRINSIPFLTIAGGTIGLSATLSGIILRD